MNDPTKLDKQLSDLELQLAELESQVKLLKRKQRADNNEGLATQREEREKQRYEKLLSEGQEVAPLIKSVDLESLVGSEIYEQVLAQECLENHYEHQLRGKVINFYAPNLRALWQSFGQEYIEPELLNYIDTLSKSSTYIDVGASTGIFSLYAASKGIKTYCLEPESQNYAALSHNAFLNFQDCGENLNCFNLAASDKSGFDSMYIKHFSTASHEKILGSPTDRSTDEGFNYEFQQRITTISLDDFCNIENIAPTHIKIDVDGVEDKVVNGMKNLLKSTSLESIFIELTDSQPSSQRALDTLLKAGFTIVNKVRVQNYFGDFNYILKRKA